MSAAFEPGTGASATVTDEIAVRITGGTKAYGAGGARVRALSEVSLAVPVGRWVAIMGPSGSGKSTLLHCLAGLERLDAGRVVLAGHDVTRADDKTLTRLRRSEIGFVFQNFNLVAALSAEANVALPLRLAGHRRDRAVVRRALAQVGLGDRARHRPAQLSGGQQQRVAIARAIVTAPQVLFADEPTGALDTASGRTVLDLMRAMADGRSGAPQTIVMVTHDPVAAAQADEVVFLRDGVLADRLPDPASCGAAGVARRLAALETGS